MRGPIISTGDALRSTKDGVTWFDNGTKVAIRSKVNLVGISVSDDPATRTVTITGSAASGLTVRKNSGSDVGTRPRLNLIEGSNVTLTVADDAGDDEIDVTIAASSTDTWSTDLYSDSYWGRRHVIGVGSTSISGEGLCNLGAASAVTSPGVVGRIFNSDGLWIDCKTGTGAAPVDAGMPVFSVANGAARRAVLPVWTTWVMLPVVTGAFNVWCGLTDATAGISSPQAGVNPNTLHCAGFRFFPSLGGTPDTEWWTVSGDNSSGQSTSTGVTVSAATLYKLTVDMSESGHIKYYVNDVLKRDETSVLPGSTTNLGIVVVLRRTTGTTDRSIYVRGDTIRYTV